AAERVGLPAHLFGGVDQAFHRGGGGDPFGDRGVAFDGAEFGLQISLPVDAFARNPGIEEIRPPVDADGDVGAERQRAFEPALADIAPRADHVGDDVDMDGAWFGGFVGLLRHDAVLRVDGVELSPYG